MTPVILLAKRYKMIYKCKERDSREVVVRKKPQHALRRQIECAAYQQLRCMVVLELWWDWLFLYPAFKQAWMSGLPAQDWEGTITWLCVLQSGSGQCPLYLFSCECWDGIHWQLDADTGEHSTDYSCQKDAEDRWHIDRCALCLGSCWDKDRGRQVGNRIVEGSLLTNPFIPYPPFW